MNGTGSTAKNVLTSDVEINGTLKFTGELTFEGKLEGDKLTRMQTALELVGGKFNDLKRVVVFSLAEGEKPPQGAVQKEEVCFLVEYYAPVGGPAKNDRDARGGKGGPGDRKGKRGGRGGPGGGRDSGRGPGGGGGGGRGDSQGPRGPKPIGAGAGPNPVRERKPV